jgi:hypothetical protein
MWRCKIAMASAWWWCHAMDGKWNCMTSGIHILHNRLIERVMPMPRVSEFRVLGFRVMLMQRSLRLNLMF